MHLYNNPTVVRVWTRPRFTRSDCYTRPIPGVAVGDIGIEIGYDEQHDSIVVLDSGRVEAIRRHVLEPVSDLAREQMWRDCLYLSVGDVDDAIEAYWRHLRVLTGRDRARAKVCTSCRVAKPLEAFSMDATQRDGFALRCRDCERERQAAMREQ